VTRHADAETIARFRAGDLPWWWARRVSAHLAQCAICRELDSQLAEVPAQLASVSTPPMPQALTTRIQGVLAREAALRTAAPQTATAPTSLATPAVHPPSAAAGQADHGGRRRRQPWRDWWHQLPWLGSPVGLRIALATAAVVVLAGGGLGIALHAMSSGPSAPSSASAGPRAAPAAGVQGPSYGPVLEYAHDGQQYRVTPIMTDTDFTPGQLASQVSGLAGRSSSALVPAPGITSGHAPGTLPSSTPTSIGKFSITGLDSCLNRMTAGNLLVLLVDVARFQAVPATIIVTEASSAGPEQIWVVGTTCSATSSDVLAHTQMTGGS
jgi:hypothetical protein